MTPRCRSLTTASVIALVMMPGCSKGPGPSATPPGPVLIHVHQVTVEVMSDLIARARGLGVGLPDVIRRDVLRADAQLNLPRAHVSISSGRGQPATGLGGGTD